MLPALLVSDIVSDSSCSFKTSSFKSVHDAMLRRVRAVYSIIAIFFMSVIFLLEVN
ncbi:hypothetical protein SDC9_103764 [bioreactor metagenome]|uniref:Uncharacterized protein n=1 Tax=bioreactor metagenome TaxID=1076179 RepID=A0A645AV04_9ZZZZ